MAKKRIICRIPETMCRLLDNECDKVKDHLTGLGNEQMYKEKSRQAISFLQRYNTREHKHPFSMLAGDIDFFKKINDRYGHPYGNKVLKTTACILKNNIRGADFIARLYQTGDEFMIGLPNTDLYHAILAAEKLKKAISEYYFDRLKGNISLTFGAADLETVMHVNKLHSNYDPVNLVDKMIECADEALLEGKLTDKGCIRPYASDISSVVTST